MRSRRDQHQPGNALRKIERERQRQRTAPGMTDDDDAIDVEGIEHVAQHRGLIGRRTPLAAFARAKAEARPIDEDDAMARGEMFAERQMHVLEIGAGAVQNHDRRRARRGSARSHFDYVLRETADIDETATRPMQPLDQQCADQRDQAASAQHRNDDDQRGHGRWSWGDCRATIT